MGSGSFNVVQYRQQAQTAVKTENSGFTAKAMCDEFNPAKVDVRESKKSPFNDFRDPITVLIGLDVTGSMDVIPKNLLKGSLGDLMVNLKKIYNRPNENLQISFAGIGDAKADESPLQVTHFESDNRFSQQLQRIWLEGGGGANGAESYNLLWYYAANKTHLNYVQQDNRKGILITIGDDNVHPSLTASEIQMWLDSSYKGGEISNEVLLKGVREQYDVYHITVTDGQAYNYDYVRRENKTKVQQSQEQKQWQSLLGHNNVIQAKSGEVASAIESIIIKHRPNQQQNMTHLNEEEWVKATRENLTNTQWQMVLSYTLCPITRRFMKYPVVWGDNKRAYEKDAVKKYVSEHQKDPITQAFLRPDQLILKVNSSIAQLCLNYESVFNALPSEKQQELIELTLPTSNQNNKDEMKVINNNDSMQQQGFFAPKKPAQDMKSFLQCPLTLRKMINPVMLVETGQTYEEEAIKEWLANNDIDPLTRTPLKSKELTPNYALKSICDEYSKKI